MIEQLSLFDITRKAAKLKCPSAYAAHPGSGPEGESCKTCKHHVKRRFSGKIYHKCNLISFRWTRGSGTDIRVNSLACERWEDGKEA